MDTWLTSERELKKEKLDKKYIKKILSANSKEKVSITECEEEGKEWPCPCPFTLISAGQYQTETVVHYTTYITISAKHFYFSFSVFFLLF